jgi:hypothetical protein
MRLFQHFYLFDFPPKAEEPRSRNSTVWGTGHDALHYVLKLAAFFRELANFFAVAEGSQRSALWPSEMCVSRHIIAS